MFVRLQDHRAEQEGDARGQSSLARLRERLPDPKLMTNVFFVYLLMISNYVMSFITTPYLSRALGVAGYGAFSYCLSANAYVWMVIDWGFVVGAVRAVARARDKPVTLERTFWITIMGRALLAGPALLLLLALASVSRGTPFWVVMVSGLLTLVGGVVSADWFVQGVERMGLYLASSVLARLAGFALTLTFIKGPNDMAAAAIIHGLSGLFTGVAGFCLVLSVYGMERPRRWRVRQALARVIENGHYFISRSNSLLYVSAAPVVLGIVSTTTALGIYGGADKIARVTVSVVGPLSLALISRLSAMMHTNKHGAGVMAGRAMLIQLCMTIPLGVFLFVFADQISDIVLGPKFHSSAEIIRLLSPTPVLVCLSGCLGGQFLVPLGHASTLSRVTLISSLFYVAALFVLGAWMGAKGAAIAFLLAEVCLTIGFSFMLLRYEGAYVASALSGVVGGGRGEAETGAH